MRIAKGAKRARARRSLPKNNGASPARGLELIVQYATRSRTVPTRSEFRKWILAALGREARITVRLVGVAEGRELNCTYRGKDYATNVLTFVLRDRVPYVGDLALCGPVVSREARAQRKNITAHYAHLTVHGVLHLQGYEHESDAEARAMETRETRILKRLGYPPPYTPRPCHG